MFRRRILFLNVTTWLALAVLGSVLAWVEFGAMWFFGSVLPAYPSGWPFCHCVRFRALGNYDLNLPAMVANGVACMLLLAATAFVMETWCSYSGNRRQLRLTSFFAGMTVAAVMLALLGGEEALARLAIWQHIGLAPRRFFPPFGLTHWSIRHPYLDWCLRIVILAAITCTASLLVWQTAHLGRVGIAWLRRMISFENTDSR